STASHTELQEVIGKPVITLQLVDPRFYHLDTALMVLSDTEIAYYPPAFSEGSRRVLERLFPDAVIATEQDAVALGLNGVSDGRHVIHTPRATDLAAALAERGFEPVGVDTSELLKGGGGAKCCTLEIRPAPQGQDTPQTAELAAGVGSPRPRSAAPAGLPGPVHPPPVDRPRGSAGDTDDHPPGLLRARGHRIDDPAPHVPQ